MRKDERARRAGPGRRAPAATLALALVAGLAVSCSLAGYATQGEAGADEVPTAVFSDYTHTVVVRGKKNFELKADRAEVYETGKRTILTGVSFAEYNPDTGERLSLGQADGAIYHGDTKDAEFSGNVRLESKKEDAVLQGEYLRWLDKDKRLEGRLDRTVTISRADGSRVSGAGFEADARRRYFSFREGVEGRIESKPGAE